MPRKLGPRHARSRRALATVNRLASAANDIQRLAWHDHRTRDGEGAYQGTFAPGAAPIDRQIARHLSALWLFTRQLAVRKVTPAMRDAAVRHVLDLGVLDQAQAKATGRVAFPEREYEAVLDALKLLGRRPRAQAARALSHVLARFARTRCNWNANAAYKKRAAGAVVWSEGALWGPQKLSRRAAAKALIAQGAAKAAQPEKTKGKKPRAGKKPAKAEPVLEILPGGEEPVPSVTTGDDDDDAEQRKRFGVDGLRGLRGSIFALPLRRVSR